MLHELEGLARRLARLATHYDITGEWPEKSLQHLTQAGAWTWVIPERYGGRGLDPHSQAQAYEAVACGCMSSCLILTQRDRACELLAEGENEEIKDELLPRLAAHEFLITVGISQITTSHQTGRPALVARPANGHFRLSGFMPWVTGAVKSRYVVTGAALEDGRQVLACLPLDRPGVTVDPPMQLMSLQSSLTSEVYCKDVVLDRRWVVRGPAEHVLASRSTVKPLVVATCGVGLARALFRAIAAASAEASPGLREFAEECQARYEAVRERVFRYAATVGNPGIEVPKTELRVAVNQLLLRLAAALLVFAKGSGFIRQREAQRLVREAMFFMVWSAPDDVRIGTLGGILE